MLALFFGFGRFCSAICVSCAFLDRLLAFLADFCMPWGAPGSILEGLGNVFGASEAYIFKVLGAHAHAYRTSSGYAKT